MNIQQYLEMTGLTIKQFSEITGVCQQSIYLYVNKGIHPKEWTAKKIEKKTGGKIKVKDLVGDNEEP